MHKLLVTMFFCIFAHTAFADPPVEYNETMGPIGDGQCFEMREITWPDCNPPKSCAYSAGVPIPQSPSVVQIGADFFLVPSWNYTCPSTARGRMDVASSIPSQLCIGTTDNGGKENFSSTNFVCYTTTECDESAIASNTFHATEKQKRKKWRRDAMGNVQLAEDGNNWGFWDDFADEFAKNSNCTGDANHPIQSYPSGPTPINCMGADCPTR